MAFTKLNVEINMNLLHDTSSSSLNHKNEITVLWQLNAIGKVQIVQ